MEEYYHQELMVRFRKGDTSAFAEVHGLHYHQLYFFAYKMIGDGDDARDVVSEVFVKLWDRHGNFETLSNVKAFLFITTRNDCLLYLRNAQRKKKKEKEYSLLKEEQVSYMIELIAEAELMEEIYREIKNLPEKQRTILEFYLQKIPLQEIADKLELTNENVRILKFRALGQIRTILKKRKLLAMALLMLLQRS